MQKEHGTWSLSAYDYYLPECDIAQVPATPRDHSRLLVMDTRRPPGSPRGMVHTRFFNLPQFLLPGDCLVVNETKVRHARLRGFRIPSGGQIEVLLLKPLDQGRWQALLRPSRRLSPGEKIWIPRPADWQHWRRLPARERVQCRISGDLLHVVGADSSTGTFTVSFSESVNLEEVGELPLPPYITRPLRAESDYQTVYARQKGSVAAPTAGLHFTEAMLKKLHAGSICMPKVTLHVGIGTFQPVRVDDVRRHRMHEEYIEVSEETVDAIQKTKRDGGRVIAVGTTVVRALESAAASGQLRPFSGPTDLFIYPGYHFRVIDSMLTNFHLPKSTLMLMVSAFAGRSRILGAYREARRLGYRFYSFGDAMLLRSGKRRKEANL